jgi:hypothetical protein
VIDGLAVAVGLIEMLSHCGIVTSKRGGYATPGPKIFSGLFAPYAPRLQQPYAPVGCHRHGIAMNGGLAAAEDVVKFSDAEFAQLVG